MKDGHRRPPLFPETAWGTVLAARGGNAAEAALALDDLCQRYWQPVRLFFRGAGCPDAETEDITQEFFASFLARGGFSKADPARARLRTFMKSAAWRFLCSHWRKKSAARRSATQVPLDGLPAAEEPSAPPEMAGRSYERDWALTVIDRALHRLRHSYEERGRAALFDAMRTALMPTPGSIPATDALAPLGLTGPQARVAVHRARQRLARAVREEVAATVAQSEDIDDEIRHLFASLQG